MDAIPPSIPFQQVQRVATTYGVQAPVTTRPVQPVPPVGRADAGSGGLEDSRTARLVAGVVPGGVGFEGGVPVPKSDALPMYRHPADRNAAATGVNLGRLIDTNA